MAAIYQRFIEQKQAGKKAFAVLIDPDKMNDSDIDPIVEQALAAGVDYFFVGGSLVVVNTVDQNIQRIKSKCDIPVILFPGSPSQVSKYADALFYLSLISGRNPELLIGQHVISAPMVRSSGLEVMPTGYMVIDGGAPTSVSYIANTAPIPADKSDIALCTAMAGEMLGLKLIYMDAGSGARNPIEEKMIQRVSGSISVPLIVGGGIKTPEKAAANCRAGADVVVVGNAIEKDLSLMKEISGAVHAL
ncbi:geranylgeranylglyceryl/heptaprenylglyceryl phosphate synthase [Arachidicoccus terrestris]|uniref:geranylgeranylglyceryl/heptaprenylglyceryl phosphate synthase n=1 Tax=Arachidicoccus terrestris TaxID=2875539 RepID=UPI001CC3D118|nr:geranylgeranylglyceryl/heptaprenylglyceryl phosphate synthase [Arachidicoccus terrestris]UAY56828.1 geranylgeranylglyceryl/heptaprenylglyceryl phosphate synthase [Arachidicoccus terrestris]